MFSRNIYEISHNDSKDIIRTHNLFWIFGQKCGFWTKMVKGAAVAEWLSSWLAEQEVRGSIPRLATWISEIGYLLPSSRDMAEIPLKRRKSSIQPTNQQKWFYFSKLAVFYRNSSNGFIKHYLKIWAWSDNYFYISQLLEVWNTKQ